MKIIENNSKRDFPIRITCEQVRDKYGYTYGNPNDFCGSILEIEAADIKKHSWAKFDDCDVDYGVACPVCGKFIMLDPDILNAQIRRDAPEVSIQGGVVIEP